MIVEGQSSRIQRVAHCSMAVDLSEAATAFEHGDYVRAVFSEILNVVPGREIPTDGMTKWYDNGPLLRVMQYGCWSLVDTETAAKLRAQAADRKSD